jgi:hypothetical protein
LLSNGLVERRKAPQGRKKKSEDEKERKGRLFLCPALPINPLACSFLLLESSRNLPSLEVAIPLQQNDDDSYVIRRTSVDRFSCKKSSSLLNIVSIIKRSGYEIHNILVIQLW